METSENKLNRIILKIQHQQPEIEDSAGLTDDIMQKVRNLPRTKVPKTLIWFRAVSGTAAVFLLGLFMAQPDVHEVMASKSGQALLHFTKIEIDSSCFQNKKISQRNLLESYACYLQKNAIENNRFKNIKQSSEN